MRLKKLRKQRKLKQQDIADLIPCSQSVYSRYESGEYELPQNALVTLANFYGVTIDYILGRDSIPEASEPTPEISLDEEIMSEARKIKDPRTKEEVLEYIRFKLAFNKKRS